MKTWILGFDTVLLSTKYSKAICDVTRPPTSQHTIPKNIEFFEGNNLTSINLPFNNISPEEESKRIQRHYISFYSAYQYIRNELGIQPSYAISFRPFNRGLIHPELLKTLNIQHLPDLILNTQFFLDDAARLAHALNYPEDISTYFSVNVNGLINPKMFFDYASHTFCNSVTGRKCAGIIIYVNTETIDSRFD